MGKNELGIADIREKIWQSKIENPRLTTRDLGKMHGVSHNTAAKHLRAKLQDVTIEEQIGYLKTQSAINTAQGSMIESNYLDQLESQDKMTAQEASVASSIAEKNQKRYSFLAGEGSDDKGGSKSAAELFGMLHDQLEKDA